MGIGAKNYVDEVLETYMLALAGLDQCPESAATTVRGRLEANVERAERAFSDAAADRLQGDSTAIVDAVNRLAGANQALRAGFHDSKAIVGLLADLEQATGRAEDVVRAAHG